MSLCKSKLLRASGGDRMGGLFSTLSWTCRVKIINFQCIKDGSGLAQRVMDLKSVPSPPHKPSVLRRQRMFIWPLSNGKFHAFQWNCWAVKFWYQVAIFSGTPYILPELRFYCHSHCFETQVSSIKCVSLNVLLCPEWTLLKKSAQLKLFPFLDLHNFALKSETAGVYWVPKLGKT